MKIKIREEIKNIKDEIYAIRRHFHRYPELSFKEFNTAETISEHLDNLGISHKKGVGKTGIVGEINFGPGPTIALRADMDALPIQEENNLDYKSLNDGVMHACGHDGHMAILLGAANALSNNSKLKKGTVRFIFQPAEEGLGGAKYMIEDGCLDKVDEIYGLHLWNYQLYGEVGIKDGPVMASADLFDIEVSGKGGHGATPQGTVDAIVVASNLVTMLQTIVSRNTNPLESTVLSIGKIKGGHNFNIISDKVHMSGTTRAYTEENRKMIKQRMKEVIEGVSKSFGADIKLNYKDGYPPTVNHSSQVEKVLEAASSVVASGAKNPYLSMGGEDFSYYLQNKPGCFFFVGSAPNENEILSTPHHCSHFNIDERALLIGASVYVNLIENSFS
ncbi:MAG: M20 family metallopeptidase [Candidatus Neomarinimicrobiota bacterium]